MEHLRPLVEQLQKEVPQLQRLDPDLEQVAQPSKYGASGIMTFVVGKDGKVYQKDLGPETRQLAGQMTEYNPDQSWTEVKD